MSDTGHKVIALDLRVDCARFVADDDSRTLDEEMEKLEFLVQSVLAGRGYFDIEVVVAPA